MRTITRATLHALVTVAVGAVLMLWLAAAVLIGAGTAGAHATRIATDPAENASLTQAPAAVSATFSEELQAQFAAMTVVGPDGNLWSTGDPQVQGAVLSIGVRPLGPPGSYTVNYRVTSADGHVINGSWKFELTVPGTGTPGPAASAPADAPSEDQFPVWPFFVGAVVIIGAGAVWAVRRRA
ncbi:copper resistance CopC family protein [Mycolicibacterium sp. ND9-15]|uniref:copper resistance CopC family protein n=1 Tax=Mycolicibacterium sp. ND9-15 TaxID=3042320 RepID=UPI002DDA6EAA|nr:copper resistance CopC family protein [Mycolicibacterium sp. ND9-15]WSE54374.1 copper resistance CopC family protein [Mycolicibacterium sp. ND9-15]